jgi:hypothetical protein
MLIFGGFANGGEGATVTGSISLGATKVISICSSTGAGDRHQ